jgi:hypothetical protein
VSQIRADDFEVVPDFDVLAKRLADFGFARESPQRGADFVTLLKQLDNGVQGDKSACACDEDGFGGGHYCSF